jgi:hypothetical protein
MDAFESKISNEISSLNDKIYSCVSGQEGLKNEYIAARSSYYHVLYEYTQFKKNV